MQLVSDNNKQEKPSADIIVGPWPNPLNEVLDKFEIVVGDVRPRGDYEGWWYCTRISRLLKPCPDLAWLEPIPVSLHEMLEALKYHAELQKN